MAQRPKADVILHPGMRPAPLPFDFRQLSADQFREVFESQRYRWIAAPEGGSWSAHGVFTCADISPTYGNRIFTRLVLEDAAGDQLAHIDLTPAACVSLGRHLLEYAIASANVNAEHQVVADRLMETLSGFLHPGRFAAFKNSLMHACREELKAELLIDHARNQSARD